eukprot:TRINITY_DN23263_c0_g1_i1.p1 TRINITY_DN23263_c0_g1~~TRINITY_DN23263_c0_g1_i1.p1  ORF type:complete len:214 (-),score=42.36 TRINITY_DN23263_c0_g1_i1:381-1022(-)
MNHAWLLSLRPALLADTGEGGRLDVPADEALPTFMSRYSFIDDIEGRDCPAHEVFFPLLLAATEGNAGIVRALVAAGADVHRRLLGVGTSSLEAASLCDHSDIVEFLLSKKADLHGFSFLEGNMPVHKAAEGGACRTLRFLLDQKADINAKMKNLRTPLICAADADSEGCLRLLLSAGAELEARDGSGLTAAEYAQKRSCSQKLIDALTVQQH